MTFSRWGCLSSGERRIRRTTSIAVYRRVSFTCFLMGGGDQVHERRIRRILMRYHGYDGYAVSVVSSCIQASSFMAEARCLHCDVSRCIQTYPSCIRRYIVSVCGLAGVSGDTNVPVGSQTSLTRYILDRSEDTS